MGEDMGLKYHYDLYDGDLKEFIERLVQFIKEKLNIKDKNIRTPQSYINFYVPKANKLKKRKKVIWIDERNKNYKNINLRIFNIDSKKDKFRELKNISKDVLKISNRHQKDGDFVDIKIKKAFELNKDFERFIKRKYEEYKKFKQDKEDIRNSKDYESDKKIGRQKNTNKYNHFNNYDLKLLITAYPIYLGFKNNNPEAEEYKFDILKGLNERLDIENISKDNIIEIIKLLTKKNPNKVSFVHWSNLDDLKSFAVEQPGEVSYLLKNLFNNDLTIKERINEFLDEAREFDENISLGTPLFAYIMSVFDYKNYSI